MYFLKRYQNGARQRKIDWNLTSEEFGELIFLNCFICGAEPVKKNVRGNGRELILLANGIDRIDNTRGYHPDNVAPACETCNIAKRDKTLDEFLAWIARAAAHQAGVAC